MARMAWLFAIGVLLGSSVPAHAQRKRGVARSAPAHTQVEPAPAPATAPVVAPTAATADVALQTAAPDAAPAAEIEGARPADSAALQQELAQLMDDLVQARERVAVLGKALFHTKVRVRIDASDTEDQVLGKIALRLDGAAIFSGDGATLGDPERTLFEGFAAPGPHVLELEVEQRARADEAYRYTLRESYRFEVVGERRTDLRLRLEDDSDIAEDFHDDRSGEYDVHTRLQVRAVPLNED